MKQLSVAIACRIMAVASSRTAESGTFGQASGPDTLVQYTMFEKNPGTVS